MAKEDFKRLLADWIEKKKNIAGQGNAILFKIEHLETSQIVQTWSC